MCSKAGVQAHFKGTNTVNELLVAYKDKHSIIQKGEFYTDTDAINQGAQ